MFSLKFRQEPLEFLNERMYINTQDEVQRVTLPIYIVKDTQRNGDDI